MAYDYFGDEKGGAATHRVNLERHMQLDLRWVLWASSVFALATFVCIWEGLGSLKQPSEVARPLSPMTAPAIAGSGYAANSVYPSTDASQVPPNVKLYGTWMGSDASTGSATTAWYAAASDLAIMVAGYPTHSQMSLMLEIESRRGVRRNVGVTPGNPGEQWTTVALSLPPDATRFRIHAVDGSKAYRGWLGFSEPFAFVAGSKATLPIFGYIGQLSLYVGAALSLLTGILCALAAWKIEAWPKRRA